MFIKSIELIGFKTFAEPTEIKLTEGITAIVGPNGCGKSNVADALMWVLGESNVRNIRGQKATDVIFNGAEHKRALGMAEVNLTLDNSDGTLPVSFNEVTITRRAFRSGEGEFFINKTRCRLRDIYELFLDTGIGREAYSFVTQGQIDSVLSARPEDRRELIEEAAGVKKYRYRREEALRKLEKTEANLHRVSDIMAEISGQLEPLAAQSEQARRYNELSARLNEIEIGILIRDLRRYTQALAEIRHSKEGAAERIGEYDRLIAELESEREKQAEMLEKIEEQVEAARRVQSNLSANVARLESKAQLLAERLKSAQSEISRTDSEIAALNRAIEQTTARIAQLESDEAACAEACDRAQAEVESKTKTLADLDKLFEEASRAVSDQKAGYLELAKEIAAKRNALANSRDRIAQLESALFRKTSEIAALRAQQAEVAGSAEQAAARAAELEKSIQKLTGKLAALNADRDRAQSELSELNLKHADLTREIAARSSRLGALREMAESHEGFFEGVRSVLAAAKSGKLAGEFAVVADVITVPKGYETAIEVALGANVQDIIAGTVDQAKSAIAFLKKHECGRATFLPLDNMHPENSTPLVSSRSRLATVSKRGSGVLGIAADLVSYDARYDPAIRSLLGRVVVAETIDDAVVLSRELEGWNRIVTLDGELIMPSGAITGGSRKSRSAGLLIRKQEIDSLTAELAVLDKEAARLAEATEAAERRVSGLATSIASAELELNELRTSHLELTNSAALSARESERLAKQIETAEVEKSEAELLLAEESRTAAELAQLLETVGRENEDLDQKVAGAQQDIEAIELRRSQARDQLTRLQVELAASVERASAIRSALVESRTQLERAKVDLDARRMAMDAAAQSASALSTEAEAVEAEIKLQRELLCAADANLNTLLAERADRQASAAQTEARLRDTSAARNKLMAESHDADVREARFEVQVSSVAQRLAEEYSISVEQALAWPEDIEIERGAAAEVARLRREIKDMGPVNTGAIAEYERVKERWDFLTAQRTDLEEARDQINAAIREIDSNTREMFVQTFNTVAANFDMMFKRLFGGGKTELVLTDPNDLLETGIDVIVQPPGKKLQDLALLSGGERALTACAFIFALLMVRPSPFVLMDEVDAPLDESNIERFVEVLRDFAYPSSGSGSQFIVITHNRATMEAADNLYGVTMQDPGISKIISVRLASEDQAANLQPEPVPAG